MSSSDISVAGRISPLVGMAVGVVPLPRLMPQSNYNFQIMSAEGLQIKKEAKACLVWFTALIWHKG
ncbi:major capsid protein [Cronobacter sakazakii]|uniref:major capsid protein n=1 Tax=Cronobacter sakazakii TaxID=28141 RepID=UPI001F5B5E6E